MQWKMTLKVYNVTEGENRGNLEEILSVALLSLAFSSSSVTFVPEWIVIEF
jgi:hypothetical protein